MKKFVLFCGIWVAVASATRTPSIMAQLDSRLKAVLPRSYKLKGSATNDDADECFAINCGKKDESCNDLTFCPATTGCYDSICREPKAGEECVYDECYGDLYCSSGKCKEATKPGAECTSSVECGNDYYCNTSQFQAETSVCKKIPRKEGDSCDFNFMLCPRGTYCSSVDNTCKRPSGIGQPCKGNDCEGGSYCNEGICTEFPGPGEECLYDNCNSKAFCRSDINKCINNPSPKGGYCESDPYSVLRCADGLSCDPTSNTCVDFDGSCMFSVDCPNFPNDICINGKCAEALSLGDGAACPLEDPDDPDTDMLGILFSCKDGYACVPGTNPKAGTCTKVTTKASDKKECKTNSDCANDAHCVCDYEDGKSICIPYLYSDKGLLKEVKGIINEYRECIGGDESPKCKEFDEKTADFEYRVAVMYDPYSPTTICYEGAASSIIVSAFAVLLSTLFVLVL